MLPSGLVLRAWGYYAAFGTCLWVAHLCLQQQYYRHCQSNLLRVILFGNSSMCTSMRSLLSQIEAASAALMPSVLGRLLQPWLAQAMAGVHQLLGLASD